MKVGDLIKSFDFPGNLDCYMIGKVTELEGNFITCETVKQVFSGVEEEITDFNKTFRTVVQGAGTFDGIFGSKFQRIVVIG